MCEGFIRVCHSVNVVSFLNCVAAIIGCIEQLADQSVFHRFLASFASVCHNPANR
jgi:hypothetical protein